MKEKHANKFNINIVLLGIVSFLNDLGSEMILPILPMFITSLGGAGLVVGLIGGVRESISSILKIFSGYWSDRTGRRKAFVTAGYLTSAVFKLLLAFSQTWQHILVFTGFERVGKGLRTAPRDAIIADSMPKARGRGFGVHRAMDTAGAVLGSAAVFLLFWFFGLSFKSIILLAAVIGFLSLVPLYFVTEKKREQSDTSMRIGLKNLPLQLKLFIFISGIFSLANFSYMFFILRAQEHFTGKLSIGAPILLYILYNIVYTLFAVPFGALSDRVGRRRVIAAGYLLFTLTTLGFAYFTSLPALVVLFGLYGMVYAITDGNQRAYVADLAPAGLKATALGTFHTVTGLGALPSSIIAGFLWQTDPVATFIYGAAVSFISVLLFIVPSGYFEK
ncbi:multidrug resistance protein MdtH [archaeon BMS3Abin16]|nr:multidrug resistance protein MdtH [archaeon BMS3Abin16]